ncbi:hypothetical protein [Levilactobacillus bambusae]|uniref:Uncharacterized protein n=1 Tax=Levilactobacillus bambusae TaxID=2024736 RepID=A0A2V1N1H4_9LACO|nr:hypothetical protein [Levilactobacillus bambusae]PWG01097.1 hypothetical protein DCM90_02675 [Levilactobacillus bambusae]
MAHSVTLEDIMTGYLANYNDEMKTEASTIIDGNFPIMWFGDLNAYEKSDHKVVTVGISPSDHEFDPQPDNSDAYLRFKYTSPSTDNDYQEYKENFNTYFGLNPYGHFFTDYEHDIVQPILGSQYGYGFKSESQPKNQLIHLDCRTALATHPNWSALKSPEQIQLKNQFIKPGNQLFVQFLELLQPDITFVSSGRDDFFGNVLPALKAQPEPTDQKAQIFWVTYPNSTNQKAILWKENGQWPSANAERLITTVKSDSQHADFFNQF